MDTFAWPTRLKYSLLAGAAGWVAGYLASFPFEFALAWRYVDGNARRLPLGLAEGALVWGAFSLFMGMAGFLPLMLPAFLLLSPRWIVGRRSWLILGSGLGALLLIYHRMGLLHAYFFRHPRHTLIGFFFTAPNFFVVTFAVAAVWAYVTLAQRRLGRLNSR